MLIFQIGLAFGVVMVVISAIHNSYDNSLSDKSFAYIKLATLGLVIILICELPLLASLL